MADPLDRPQPALLIKLGSIARHAEEALENGHPLDLLTITSLLNESDVRGWMAAMDKMALLPVKRASAEGAQDA